MRRLVFLSISLAVSLSRGETNLPAVPLGIPVREIPAVEVSTPPQAAIARLAEQREQWYGVYEVNSGSKLGWYSSAQQTAHVEGTPSVRFTNRSQFVVLQGTKLMKSYLEEEFHFSKKPPYGLLRLKMLETKAGGRREVTVRRVVDDKLVRYLATSLEGNEVRRESLVGLELSALDHLAASTWAAAPERSPGQQIRVRTLDIRELTPFVERFTFERRVAAEPAENRVRCEDLKDGDVSHFQFDSEGLLHMATLGGATVLRPEPKNTAQSIPNPVDLFGQSLVPCDKPLGDFLTLRSLEFRLEGPAAFAIPDTERQKVTSKADGKWTLSLGRNRGLSRHVSLAEKEQSLLSSARIPLENPTILALAQKATAGASTVEDKVANLVKFVQQFLKDDHLAEPLTLWDIIQQKRGDCTEHSLLFTALARASGIPCREVSGYLYLGDATQAFGGHAWNEVVINNRWHEVDPTWGLASVTPGHILLTSGKATMREMRYLTGGNTITVLEHAR